MRLPLGGRRGLPQWIHNWDDEHAHRILARCVAAAHPAGRILVIEEAGTRRANSEMNLAMLTCFGSRTATSTSSERSPHHSGWSSTP